MVGRTGAEARDAQLVRLGSASVGGTGVSVISTYMPLLGDLPSVAMHIYPRVSIIFFRVK